MNGDEILGAMLRRAFLGGDDAPYWHVVGDGLCVDGWIDNLTADEQRVLADMNAIRNA